MTGVLRQGQHPSGLGLRLVVVRLRDRLKSAQMSDKRTRESDTEFSRVKQLQLSGPSSLPLHIMEAVAVQR